MRTQKFGVKAPFVKKGGFLYTKGQYKKLILRYNYSMKKFFLILSLFVIFANAALCEPNYSYNIYTMNPNNKNQIDPEYLKSSSMILFIVDFSNSMNEKMGDRTKLRVALDTLTSILPQIPSNVQTGLRIYGHRGGFTYMDGCMASKLAVPLKPNNSGAILNSLYQTSAVGWTPITYSLKQAVNSDFAGVGGKKHIILLTDGGENCDESPCTYAIELMKTRNDISIDVIAFDIYDQEARNQLRCTALTTSGKFYSANSPDELKNSLFESLNIDKDVRGTIKINP